LFAVRDRNGVGKNPNYLGKRYVCGARHVKAKRRNPPRIKSVTGKGEDLKRGSNITTSRFKGTHLTEEGPDADAEASK